MPSGGLRRRAPKKPRERLQKFEGQVQSCSAWHLLFDNFTQRLAFRGILRAIKRKVYSYFYAALTAAATRTDVGLDGLDPVFADVR
jgi:hypothetical protein